MSILKANVDDLKEAERLISAAYYGLNQLRGELQDILNNLESSWDGNAAGIYKNRIYDYIKEIDNLQPVIKKLDAYTKFWIAKIPDLSLSNSSNNLLDNTLNNFGGDGKWK